MLVDSGMSPLPAIAASFAAGAGLGLLAPTTAIGAIAAAAIGATGFSLARRAGTGLLPVAAALALALGWLRAPPPEDLPRAPAPREPCQRALRGTLARPVLTVEGRHRLAIDLDACTGCLSEPRVSGWRRCGGRLYVIALEGARPRLRQGDLVRLRSTARPWRRPANPPGGKRAEESLSLSAVVPHSGAIALEEARSRPTAERVDRLRSGLARFWTEALDEAPSRLARALGLGQSAALSGEQREAFRRTGTAHLLAISGLHLGLVVLAVFWLLRLALLRVPPLARRLDSARIAAAATIPVAVAFTLLTGARTPTIRACAMAVFMLSGRALAQRGRALESLALAGAALLAADPTSLAEPGFQLSFAAVLAFLLVLRPGAGEKKLATLPGGDDAEKGKLRSGLRSAAGWFARLLRSTLAASAATVPLVLLHFDRASVVGVPANLLAVPAVSLLVLPAVLVTELVAVFSPAAASIAARAVGPLLASLENSLRSLAELPCVISDPSPLVVAGVFALAVAVLLLLAGKPRTAAIPGAAFALLVSAAIALDAPKIPRDRLAVDFLDVGQGDSSLVTFPCGEHWLIDCGGTAGRDPGADVVAPVLERLGVERLETVVLTHPDPDHVAGLPAIARGFEVGRIWDNGQGADEGAHPAYAELLDIAEQESIRVRRTREICGEHRVGEATLEVLHPCHDRVGYDPTLEFNDNSIAMRIDYGRTSFLLTGDLSAAGERILLENDARLRADVLKLGHHGSRSSSTPELLEAVSPAVAVASCGPWNRHGMPHRRVRLALAERTISLFRTDRQGAIRATSDGDRIAISATRAIGADRERELTGR
ncbi:MAG: DNA internalization-related competence protein ComEC/Rec2 [Polyangia bacterium]